jgi:hypothetical protein
MLPLLMWYPTESTLSVRIEQPSHLTNNRAAAQDTISHLWIVAYLVCPFMD